MQPASSCPHSPLLFLAGCLVQFDLPLHREPLGQSFVFHEDRGELFQPFRESVDLLLNLGDVFGLSPADICLDNSDL